MKTDESEQSGAINCLVANHFVPTHVVLNVSGTAGALNADGTVNIGTSSGGTQIASAVALTGLTAVGATRVVPISGAQTHTVLGNATLYANVEAAETGAGTLTLDVKIFGFQV
jgi:hypothetical protein